MGFRSPGPTVGGLGIDPQVTVSSSGVVQSAASAAPPVRPALGGLTGMLQRTRVTGSALPQLVPTGVHATAGQMGRARGAAAHALQVRITIRCQPKPHHRSIVRPLPCSVRCIIHPKPLALTSHGIVTVA